MGTEGHNVIISKSILYFIGAAFSGMFALWFYINLLAVTYRLVFRHTTLSPAGTALLWFWSFFAANALGFLTWWLVYRGFKNREQR